VATWPALTDSIQADAATKTVEVLMNEIIYLIGLIVVVMFVLGRLGLR